MCINYFEIDLFNLNLYRGAHSSSRKLQGPILIDKTGSILS